MVARWTSQHAVSSETSLATSSWARASEGMPPEAVLSLTRATILAASDLPRRSVPRRRLASAHEHVAEAPDRGGHEGKTGHRTRTETSGSLSSTTRPACGPQGTACSAVTDPRRHRAASLTTAKSMRRPEPEEHVDDAFDGAATERSRDSSHPEASSSCGVFCQSPMAIRGPSHPQTTEARIWRRLAFGPPSAMLQYKYTTINSSGG